MFMYSTTSPISVSEANTSNLETAPRSAIVSHAVDRLQQVVESYRGGVYAIFERIQAELHGKRGEKLASLALLGAGVTVCPVTDDLQVSPRAAQSDGVVLARIQLAKAYERLVI